MILARVFLQFYNYGFEILGSIVSRYSYWFWDHQIDRKQECFNCLERMIEVYALEIARRDGKMRK